MSAGCSMLAMTRSRPPQCRQVSMSMANTRWRRCAQVRFGEPSAAEAAPCGLAGLAAAGCVLGTMRGRSGLAGANTPWYRVYAESQTMCTWALGGLRNSMAVKGLRR